MDGISFLPPKTELYNCDVRELRGITKFDFQRSGWIRERVTLPFVKK